MHKTSILAHATELKKILSAIGGEGTFTSSSVGIHGNIIKKLVNRKIVTIVGFDRKHQRNVYKITSQQYHIITDTIGE